MADYNRFVSYIYLYERGVKAMNTGFAKVESRGGQCRVNIAMKNMYHESHIKFSVYMFVRKNKMLVGIYLGDLATQNNSGEFFVVTDSGNIQGSGYTLEDVKGMIIRGENGKIYGTGWDDEALAVDHFVPADEYVQESETDLSDSSDAAKPLTAESVGMSPLVMDEEEEMNETEEDVAESEYEAETESEPDTEETEKEETRYGEYIPDPGQQSPLEKIIDTGMRMYPFEDDQITACVRLEPQDIGLLPMQYWRLASNSFMLHGYYSYRHLIMARVNDGKFIFGVPGVNYERERFIAHMFGFDKFKPVRAAKTSGNEFGYWYMELDNSGQTASGV